MLRAFAKRAESLERLDVLLENAGISTAKFVEVAGHESTITTNVISTFLLALLMLPVLQKTSRKHNVTPTLTIVSSEVHFFTRSVDRNPSITETTAATAPTIHSALRFSYIESPLTTDSASPSARHPPFSEPSIPHKKPEWRIDTMFQSSWKSLLAVK